MKPKTSPKDVTARLTTRFRTSIRHGTRTCVQTRGRPFTSRRRPLPPACGDADEAEAEEVEKEEEEEEEEAEDGGRRADTAAASTAASLDEEEASLSSATSSYYTRTSAPTAELGHGQGTLGSTS